MEALYISKIADNISKLIAIKKDEFSPAIREKINKGQLRLTEAAFFHTASFTTLAESVELFTPNHPSGPGYSSFLDGKISDHLIVVDFISLQYMESSSLTGAKFMTVNNPAITSIVTGAVVEFYKNKKMILRRQAYHFSEWRELNGDAIGNGGLSLRRPIILTPDDQLQVTIKFPHGYTYTPASGKAWFRLNLFGVSAKIR